MPKLVNVNQLDKNSIEYAFNLNQRTEKIVTFIFPSLIEGAFGPLCKFPIGGKIKKIEAYCQDVASVDTIFTIEKSTQEQITKFTSDEQQLVADLTKLTNSHTELVDATDSKKTNCKDNLVTSMLVTPWKKILSSNIVIPKNQNFQNNTYVLSDDVVAENTIFRINFLEVGFKSSKTAQTIASNLTIQIIIETNDNY
jgi:hypothetical protein